MGYVEVPGVPEDELDGFDDWTVALFRDVVNAYASASKKSSESFLEQCIESAAEKHDDAICEVSNISDRRHNWDLLVARERSKALVNPGILATIARYDTSCERSFFRILHEIQRLQAIRLGAAVSAPAVVDVDMTTRREDKD